MPSMTDFFSSGCSPDLNSLVQRMPYVVLITLSVIVVGFLPKITAPWATAMLAWWGTRILHLPENVFFISFCRKTDSAKPPTRSIVCTFESCGFPNKLFKCSLILSTTGVNNFLIIPEPKERYSSLFILISLSP